MEYYNLFFDHEAKGGWHLDVPDGEGPWGDIWAYTRCEHLENMPALPFTIDRPGSEHDFNLAFNIPVVSTRLKQLIESICPEQVQFFRAEVDSPNDWYVMNALPMVDCLDYENSVLTLRDREDGGGQEVRGAIRLIIDPDRARGHHVFRITGWLIPLIVSKEIATAMQDQGMTGFSLWPVQDQ